MVALVGLLGGIYCVMVTPKFIAIYAEFGAHLPLMSRIILNSSGWLPGGILILLSAGTIFSNLMRKPKGALFASIATIVTLLISAVILPIALLWPLTRMVESEGNREEQPHAQQEAAPNP